MKNKDKNIFKTSDCSSKKEMKKCTLCTNSINNSAKKCVRRESSLEDKLEEENITIQFLSSF